MRIILDGILEGIKTRVDGSVNLSFSTNELDASKAGELFQLRGKYCKALLSDSNISKIEEELVDNTQVVDAGKKRKSSSQRLRAVIYRYFEQSGYSIEFDDFYRTEMEKIIEAYKSKLQ
jgi:hypothetical protein